MLGLKVYHTTPDIIFCFCWRGAFLCFWFSFFLLRLSLTLELKLAQNPWDNLNLYPSSPEHWHLQCRSYRYEAQWFVLIIDFFLMFKQNVTKKFKVIGNHRKGNFCKLHKQVKQVKQYGMINPRPRKMTKYVLSQFSSTTLTTTAGIIIMHHEDAIWKHKGG